MFVAAVTVVALVIGAGVGISVIEGSDAHAARAHAFDREVKQLEQFVAHARHLDFIRPVHVEMLRSDQYDIRRGNDFASTRAYLVSLYPLLKPLGLADGLEHPDALAHLAASIEYGNYKDGTIVVRGAQLTPFTRRVIVHELTHALDDQQFDFAALKTRHHNDGSGIEAIVEGDARRVENEYLASLSHRERVQSVAPAGAPTLTHANMPRTLRQLLAFPYQQGSRFLQAVAAQGGETAVDDTFRNPPVFTHEVLHPDVYLDAAKRVAEGASFRSVGSPTATSTSATGTKTRVGELITRLFLAPVLGTDRATAAAATWNGDLAMTWHDGAKSCIGIVYANPAVGHDEPLLDALRAWARATPGATFTRAQLTACA